MKIRSKYYSLLKTLLGKPAFTTEEARVAGVPRHALAYLEKKGVLERVAKGVYRDPQYESDLDFTKEDLALAAYSVPNAVICLISALDFYCMTDEIPREHWLAIPHRQRAPVRTLVRAVRMRNMSLGKTQVEIGEYQLPIFDRERCVIDAFRYLSLEIAIKALRFYLQEHESKPDLKKLREYARRLRVNIQPYILSLTT